MTSEQWEHLWESNRPLADAIYTRLKSEKAQREDALYVKALFGPQYRFFKDSSKKKAALCSRRAGKSEAIAAWLLDGGEDSPGGLSVYIALSRNNCRLILWATLQALDKRHKLGLRFKEIDNQLRVYMPNGHSIWLAGCKDSAEIEKFRGLKIRRAAIDEGASYGPYLRDLVFDVIEPALLDLDGELAIIGTPGPVPTGLFFEITTGLGTGADAAAKWSTHSWTCEQNPHIQSNTISASELAAEIELANSSHSYINKRVEKWLQSKREANKWTLDHPTYLREWTGLWVRDEGALVYPYNPQINQFRKLPEAPEREWTYAIGCDVGYEDDTAFTVGAMRRGHPEVYLIHSEKRPHMIPSAVAARLQVLQTKYNAFEIVMDTGGIGKGYAEECSQRYGLFITPAQKTRKRAFIEICRGEMLSGNIKVNAEGCAPLLLEWSRLLWNEDQTEEDERFPNHGADSALYLLRFLLPFYKPAKEEDPPTEAQIAQKRNDKHRASIVARLREKAKKGSIKRAVRQILGNEYN